MISSIDFKLGKLNREPKDQLFLTWIRRIWELFGLFFITFFQFCSDLWFFVLLGGILDFRWRFSLEDQGFEFLSVLFFHSVQSCWSLIFVTIRIPDTLEMVRLFPPPLDGRLSKISLYWHVCVNVYFSFETTPWRENVYWKSRSITKRQSKLLKHLFCYQMIL